MNKEMMVEKIMVCIDAGEKEEANELLLKLWKSNQIAFGYAGWLQDKINSIPDK